MTEHRAKVAWTGDLDGGRGDLSTASGAFQSTVRLKARVVNGCKGETTPEELLAGAHASCLSMMVQLVLKKNGHAVQRLEADVTVTAVSSPAGIKIAHASIMVVGHEPSARLTAAAFQKVVQEAEAGCPVSNALRNNVEIRVQGKLA